MNNPCSWVDSVPVRTVDLECSRPDTGPGGNWILRETRSAGSNPGSGETDDHTRPPAHQPVGRSGVGVAVLGAGSPFHIHRKRRLGEMAEWARVCHDVVTGAYFVPCFLKSALTLASSAGLSNTARWTVGFFRLIPMR